MRQGKTNRALALLWPIAAVLFVALPILSSDVGAQPGPTEWSTPLNLSAMMGRTTVGRWGSVSPEIAADSSGGLHVLWAEDLMQSASESSPCPEAVYYTHWIGESWDKPVDVFAAPAGQCVYKIAAQVDSRGVLHALWSSDAGLYHGSVDVADASCVHCWTTSRIFVGATNADVFVDSADVIHVVYVSGYDTIYYMQSRDGGVTWLRPSQIYAVQGIDFAILDARLAVGPQGILHATWGDRSAEGGWSSGGISYGRSVDGGQTWEVILQIQDTGGSPNLGMDGDENLYLVWNHPVGSKDGRYYCRSTDGGVTWSQPEVAFWNLSGQTWWPEMAQDSAGVLHLVFAARGQSDRVWHSTWTARGWSEPEAISGDLVTSENPSLALSEGNRLNAVWVDYGTQSIWFASHRTSAPAVAPVPVPTRQPMPTPSSPVVSPTAPVGPTQTETPFGSVPMSATPATQWPVLLGIVPALALVGAVILIRALRRR